MLPTTRATRRAPIARRHRDPSAAPRSFRCPHAPSNAPSPYRDPPLGIHPDRFPAPSPSGTRCPASVKNSLSSQRGPALPMAKHTTPPLGRSSAAPKNNKAAAILATASRPPHKSELSPLLSLRCSLSRTRPLDSLQPISSLQPDGFIGLRKTRSLANHTAHAKRISIARACTSPP